ncbi:MAG: COX15/CtaA family protein [Ideonella sp.]
MSLVDWSPLAALLLMAAAGALLPVAWIWRRTRHRGAPARLAALTALALFVTFDLIAFGAFTRLSDSGLGCPDWPGCYGEASPFSAREEISSAQAAMPGGPVTWGKAWIEMIHRYAAMVLGALILLIAALSFWHRKSLVQGWKWPLLTLVGILVQGAFGKYTVTLKLYPAIVTLHLLGGIFLLALLVVQHERFQQRALALAPALRRGVQAVLALVVLQVALGAWVSTNYAVLACQGFPQCNGQWWPEADFPQGFTLLRELGRAGHGGFLDFKALVAIHLAHRMTALLVCIGMIVLIVSLWRPARAVAAGLAGVLALQVLTGVGNVVLQWPLLGALLHTSGAALLVGLLVSLLVRTAPSVSSLRFDTAVPPPEPVTSP